MPFALLVAALMLLATPAFAQGPSGPGFVAQLLPLVLIFLVFWLVVFLFFWCSLS